MNLLYSIVCSERQFAVVFQFLKRAGSNRRNGRAMAGRIIVVSGRLQMRDWTDRDGNKRTSAEVVCDNVYFGDSKRDNDSGNYSQSSYAGQSGFSGNSNDSPRQSAPVPPVTPSPFEELEDDGELLF